MNVTDANGCIVSQTVTITQPSLLSANTIVVSNVSCNGGSDGIAAASASGGTTPYSYQWSPVGGSSSTATNLSAGNYSVTVTDANGCNTSAAVSITEPVTNVAAVSISANPSGTICSGTSVTFTATPTNGGTSPTYQWKVNNVVVGSGSTYTTSSLANNDNIVCVMTSNLSCVTGNPATSSAIVMSVTPSVAAGVSISANPSGAICSGASVTFTATPINGGSSPTYQWKKNNIVVGTGSTYTTSSFANNDNVVCMMTSNAPCVTGNPATSNTVTMVVNPVVTAGVSIAANPSGSICAGTSVTFTATPVNGGSSPTYQWKKNNVVVGTGSSYSTASLVNGDNVVCVMTSNASCVTGSPATSNSITMVVNATVTAAVSISANPSGTICSGTPVTFTAAPTNGGSSPGYQWKKNNVVVGTGSTYTATSLISNDNIVCVMTSNATCVTGNPATSNTITMAVTQNVVAGVSIAANPSGTICPGTSVTFTATPTNGGSSPAYQWKKNTVVVGTGSTYTTTSLVNNDNIICVMTSNAACVSGNPATSNTFTASVSSTVPAPPTPTGRDLICKNSTETYWVPPVTGTTFTWTVPAGASITSGQGTNSLNVHFSTSQTPGNICVYATSSCGNSTTTCKALTVATSKPATPSTITGPAIGCPNGTATYTCPAVPNADLYNWTMPTNATYGMVNNSNSMIVNFYSSFTGGTLKVAAGNCMGYSTNRSFTISSTPSTPGSISGSNSACTNQTVAYSIAAVSGATTYQWTAPAGSVIASGQGTTNVTVTFGASGGTLSVRAGNACGFSAAKTKSITVNCVARPELITQESEINSVFSLYPNPANEQITIEADEANLLLQIDIYSADGRKVKSFVVGEKPSVTIDVSTMSEGVYFFNCIAEKNTEMIQVVKY